MSTKEVVAILGKKVSARRKNHGTESTRETLMKDRVRDSKWEERKFRKERDDWRKKLESALFLGPSGTTHKFKRIVARVKEKVKSARLKIRMKNKTKIDGYKSKKKLSDKMKELSSLPEECAPLKELRVFRGEDIPAEPPKPPVVTSESIILSKAEIAILTKSPKFALRNLLSKKQYMTEIEKGLIKEKYSRIGKVEEDGVIIEDTPVTI